MEVERLKQIEDIYHAALEIPPDKRESFFKEFCGADEKLRREVESLLAFDKTFDDFIDTPPESLAAEMFAEQKKETNFIGSEIGRYKIKKLLGEGGMGKVYLAEDTELERLVALKTLPADFSNDQTRVRRFIREAKAVSALNHPNILTIYEIGNFQNLHFIATEYIKGETLRQRQIREPLNLREILDIAAQIAAALAAAHSAGIIHRDIKPENIMLRDDGFAKVLDFGLAKLTEKHPTTIKDFEAPTRKLDLTNPGTIIGTASYMSPEQVRGRADIDARTDIWSLGVVIFEILTGRVPFAGETVSDVIASILKTDAPHLSKCVADCPGELERIVTKALQKNREERYQVVKDLALDLKSLQRELEFSAELDRVTDSAEQNLNLTAEMPRQVVTTVVTDTGKRFSAFNVLSILVFAAFIFGGAWWFFGRNDRSQTIDAASLKTSEIVNWTSTPGESYSVGSFSPDGKMIAFTSTKTGGRNVWIKQTASGEAVQITKDRFNNEQPIWSPSGDELAFFTTRGNQAGIWRIPILGGSPKMIAAVEDGSSVLRFWSKKDLIYYESNHDIYAIDVNSGQTKRVTDFDSNAVKADSISISPDEQRIAYSTVEGEEWSIWTKPLNADAPKKLLSTPNEIRNTVFHTDNQRIFYSALVGDVFQMFITDINAAPPKQITFAERDCFVLDVSADGAKILYGSAKEESDIWSVNLKDGKESIVASDIDSELWANVSPDGNTIAYQSIKNLSQGNRISKGAILIKKLNSDESPVQLVAEGFLPVWSPDGQTIAYTYFIHNKFQLSTIRAADGGQKHLAADDIAAAGNTILPYNRLQANYFSWSPDNTKIVYPSKRSGQSNIWIVSANGSNDTQLTDNNDTKLSFYCPLWSPDGKRIAFTSKIINSAGKPAYGVWIIDTETKNSRMMTQQRTFLRLINWTQSGKELLLASTQDSESSGLQTEVLLLRLETETGKTQQISVLKDAYLYNVHLAPDSKNIAFAARREGIDNLWLIPAAGGAEKKLTNNNDSRLYFSSLAWSPDNNSIFFGKQSRYSLLSMLTNFK
ncbi:MAG: serine/threonine-protein kinase [Acidobacteriota bacterium]|nr:serine/threonine-protein kinase [Acidobacteriota bacterium]